jgi:hypothetical protein
MAEHGQSAQADCVPSEIGSTAETDERGDQFDPTDHIDDWRVIHGQSRADALMEILLGGPGQPGRGAWPEPTAT